MIGLSSRASRYLATRELGSPRCLPKRPLARYSPSPKSSFTRKSSYHRFYSVSTRAPLPASQYNGFAWIVGGVASLFGLAFINAGERRAYAEGEAVGATEEEDYKTQLAAIQSILDSVTHSGVSNASLTDMAEIIWQKIAMRDASGLASIMNLNSQLESAIRQLTEMLAAGRDRRELCKPLAVAYILRGQYDQAMPFLTEANWEDPRDAQLYLHQGHIYLRKSNYADAFEALEKAILLNPSLKVAVAPRNEALRKMGLPEASELYWHIQGVIRYDLGMYRESYECYNKALELNPSYKESWYNRMVVKHILDQQAFFQEQQLDLIPAKLLPIVTTYEYATMAEAVYTTSAYAFPPKDWKLWLSSGDFVDHNGSLSRDGFYGAVYVNHNKKKIVLALQGTKATQDLIACAHLALNTIDRQWICAKLFGEKVHERIQEDPVLKDYQVSFTGHSLGAAQAEFLSFLHGEPAVTFESPGIKTLMSSIAPLIPEKSVDDLANWRVTGYMPQPNLINTAKEHVGKLIRIYPPLPKQLRTIDNAQVILENMEAFKRMNEIISVPGLDKLVSSPFGAELIKLLGETELIILETLHWHSMSRICSVFRHEYETGIPVKERAIVKWPLLDRYYLYWRVSKDCLGEPDEAIVSDLNREALRWANYQVESRHVNRVSLSEFTKREQTFLVEYKRIPGVFATEATELDQRVLGKYIIKDGYVETNVGLSPNHFRDYVKWRVEQTKSLPESMLLTLSSIF